jgi:predicted MPP superfamily phosphohydrolase
VSEGGRYRSNGQHQTGCSENTGFGVGSASDTDARATPQVVSSGANRSPRMTGAQDAQPRRAAHRIGGSGSRAAAWVRRLVRVPERALFAVGAFLLRWALRIVLPLAGAALMLHTFPYQATVQGVPFRVQGSILSRPYISADTTLGNWVFPHVDRLPIGVHVSPVDVNLLKLARDASGDTTTYVARLRTDFLDQLPRIGLWLAGEALLGIAFGMLLAAAVNMSVRYLRRLPRRDRELRLRARQAGVAGLVVAVVAGVGGITFDRNWAEQSRLTGTLAAAQLFPSQLQQYYQQQSKAYDVVNAILGIQGSLQSQFQQRNAPPTAFPIMFISDLHLAAAYPLVRQYAENYGVKLIVNTGDESEFGKGAELTPAYLGELSAVTRRIPMLWIAGNHDAHEIEDVMRRVPGVTVLGRKAAPPGGTVDVSASSIDAFGLRIAGLPDPRIYGGPEPFGSDRTSVTDPLERDAVDAAFAKVRGSFDLVLTHEPVAAAEVRSTLTDPVRETASGHVHAQNAAGDLQHNGGINLVEGSTGAGGLDNLNRSADGQPVPRPPIEFSIESVAANCQFTKVQRFSINAQSTADASAVQRYGDDATVSTVFFRPQDLPTDRICATSYGIGKPTPIVPGATAGLPTASPTPSAGPTTATPST